MAVGGGATVEKEGEARAFAADRDISFCLASRREGMIGEWCVGLPRLLMHI